jgi:hypothetical protein
MLPLIAFRCYAMLPLLPRHADASADAIAATLPLLFSLLLTRFRLPPLRAAARHYCRHADADADAVCCADADYFRRHDMTARFASAMFAAAAAFAIIICRLRHYCRCEPPCVQRAPICLRAACARAAMMMAMPPMPPMPLMLRHVAAMPLPPCAIYYATPCR